MYLQCLSAYIFVTLSMDTRWKNYNDEDKRFSFKILFWKLLIVLLLLIIVLLILFFACSSIQALMVAPGIVYFVDYPRTPGSFTNWPFFYKIWWVLYSHNREFFISFYIMVGGPNAYVQFPAILVSLITKLGLSGKTVSVCFGSKAKISLIIKLNMVFFIPSTKRFSLKSFNFKIKTKLIKTLIILATLNYKYKKRDVFFCNIW